VTGSCEHGYEASVSITCWELLEGLSSMELVVYRKSRRYNKNMLTGLCRPNISLRSNSDEIKSIDKKLRFNELFWSHKYGLLLKNPKLPVTSV
jgi:hypothetical protein